MSNHSTYKEHRKAIFDELILSGHTKNYIRRALKVYERNYGLHYNIEVIAEIVRRLQKKDRNKAKQKRRQHHPKSQSETFDFGRSFTPQKSKRKSKESNGKITPFDANDELKGFAHAVTKAEENTNAINNDGAKKEEEELPSNGMNRMHIKSSRSLNSKEFCIDIHGISSSNVHRHHIGSKSWIHDNRTRHTDEFAMDRWVHVLKTCGNKKSERYPLNNDLLMTLNEMKEYFARNDNINWQYFVRNDVLSVLCHLICNILSPQYVKLWHHVISIALDIVCVLMDYYLSQNVLFECASVIGCVIEIMSFHAVLLDYGNESILLCCCNILSKLTFENEDNMDCVMNMDGIQQIFSIINCSKKATKHNALIQSCLHLLTVLCYNCDFNKEYICGDAGGCDMIMDLLQHFMSLEYHRGNNNDEIMMMNSILRTLGNFTFMTAGCNIAALLSCSLIEILSKLMAEMTILDSNMLVSLMQIVSDIATYCDSYDIAMSPWIMQSILAISRKNRSCLLLQEYALNGVATLINLSPDKNSAILIENGGATEIFEVCKQLNYAQNIVILALRLIKAMCGSHCSSQISTHLVKKSNLFNFLTHIMKHWRLKYNSQSSDDIIRIQCCCKVIRSLTTKVSKFSKYANKCHVISGLIKLLMLNNDESNANNPLSPVLWCEIVKTFIAICADDEENCVKLAKHGTKCILNAIAVYSNINSDDIVKYISILFCNISRYRRVCCVLYEQHRSVVIDIAYHLLSENTANVLVCNQLILFLSNMLISVDAVYHMLETKLKCQSLINKILYLHSNYDPLIKTCHHYHKSIEIWLQNSIPQPQPHTIEPQQSEQSEEESQSQSHINELHVAMNEIRRFNWDMRVIDDGTINIDIANSLFQCIYCEIYSDGTAPNINGWKQIKKEVESYRMRENEYFGHLLYRSSNTITRDYVTLVALSELYCVRIRVFEMNKNKSKLSVLFDIGGDTSLQLPIIYLAFVKRRQYFLIRDTASLNIHARPLINHSVNSSDDANSNHIKQYRFYKFFAKLFAYFDCDGCGQLKGEQIYDFFVSSTLCTDILRTIWDESVGDNCPTMNLKQFICAMQLILREQIELRNCNTLLKKQRSHHSHIQHHGSYAFSSNELQNNQTKSKRFERSNKKSKISVKKSTTNANINGARNIICGSNELQSRNSANDADDAFADHLIAAGIPMMSYPIHCNPFDLSQLLLSSRTGTNTTCTHTTTATATNTDIDPCIRTNVNCCTGTGTATYDDDNITATAATMTDNIILNRKTDEFIRFFNEINFSHGASAEAYYDKIAEFEYNDIEKMMELDIDILIYDVEMNENDAVLLLNKVSQFSKMNVRFKKWLINQCRMRRYAVKFSNEGILTLKILHKRCKTLKDLIQIIGEKNKNDAHVLWRKIPPNK